MNVDQTGRNQSGNSNTVRPEVVGDSSVAVLVGGVSHCATWKKIVKRGCVEP